MSFKKKITINAFSAILQVVFTALLYFFLYKYLLLHLGVKQLGVWSLILSFSSIANLANLGITSGLVKFVAEYIAERQELKIGKLILTAFITMLVLFTILSFLILLGAKYFLCFVIDKQFLPIAISILPFSLGSLCINATSGVFTSVLEGFQKNYLRNFIYVLSGFVMYFSTVILSPVLGLKGVALAQLIQSGFILLTALFLMKRVSCFTKFIYWRWSTQSFKELFDYGYKFQVVSICQLLFEPTTKFLLSKFGGLMFLGNYEMATRVVSQFKALLVNANQVVIPVVAENIKTQSKAYLKEFYANMIRIMLLFSFPLSTLLILVVPFISIIWIGHLENNFTYSVVILTVAYVVNIMSGPAFFSCMGEGKLNIPIIAHLVMAVLNLVLGSLFGILWGGYGIIIAWAISILFGSLMILYLYQKTLQISIKQILFKNEWLIIIFSLCLILGSILFFSFDIPGINNYIKTAILIVLFVLTYFWILIKNEILISIINLFLRNGKLNSLGKSKI